MTARRKKRAPSKRKAKASGLGSARVAEKARRSRQKTKTRPAVSPKSRARTGKTRVSGPSMQSGSGGNRLRRPPRSSQTFQKRSDAAKRGWKTRRANIRAKKRLLTDTALRKQVRQDVKKRLHITEPRDVPRWAIEPPEEWVALIEDDFQLDAHEAYTLWYSP